MNNTSIKYSGEIIGNIAGNGDITLTTKDKVCNDNILVSAMESYPNIETVFGTDTISVVSGYKYLIIYSRGNCSAEHGVESGGTTINSAYWSVGSLWVGEVEATSNSIKMLGSSNRIVAIRLR